MSSKVTYCHLKKIFMQGYGNIDNPMTSCFNSKCPPCSYKSAFKFKLFLIYPEILIFFVMRNLFSALKLLKLIYIVNEIPCCLSLLC